MRRAVWTFWSKPYAAGSGFCWREPLHHYLAWGLSLRLASRHFYETVLVTDYAGKALLVDRLGLPFTHVSTELERLRHADPAWWTLGKLVSYGVQDAPFVHLDTDVFLWKPLPAGMANAPIFAQCPERHALDEWYGPGNIEQAFAQHGLALPAEWEWSRSRAVSHFREENCGILGGTRVDFIRYYAGLAVDLLMRPDHRPAWAMLAEKAGYNPILEQFVLSACLDFHRFHPDSPFRGIGIRYLFSSIVEAFDGQTAEHLGYTHLMGDAKSNAFMMHHLERRMQQEDMRFYQRCVRLVDNGQLFASRRA